jgi:hypothetical protein
MKPTEAQLAERLPVWEALSEFFLDTELQKSDYERIAGILAATRYTEGQIEDILIGEVCPVCKWNAFDPAGEWIGFDRDWLKEKIGPRFGKRPRFRPWFVLRHRWMYADNWDRVRARVSELRAK